MKKLLLLVAVILINGCAEMSQSIQNGACTAGEIYQCQQEVNLYYEGIRGRDPGIAAFQSIFSKCLKQCRNAIIKAGGSVPGQFDTEQNQRNSSDSGWGEGYGGGMKRDIEGI